MSITNNLLTDMFLNRWIESVNWQDHQV